MRAPIIALLLAACEFVEPLPSSPTADARLRVSAFAPRAGFTGERVTFQLNRRVPASTSFVVAVGEGPWVTPEFVEGNWQFRVPDDSTDGPVSVRWDGVATPSLEAFDYHGAGRLARGRVLSDASLVRGYGHPIVVTHLAIVGAVASTEQVLVFSRFDRISTHANVGGLRPESAAQGRDGGQVVIVGAGSPTGLTCEGDGTTTIPQGFAVISVDRDDFAEVVVEVGRTGCLPPRAPGQVSRVAVDPDTNHALVVHLTPSDQHNSPEPADVAHLVKLSTGAVTVVPTNEFKQVRGAAWAEGLGFLLPHGTELLRVDPATNPDTWEGSNLVGTNTVDDLRSVVLAADRLVVGTAMGKLMVLDGRTWPPTPLGELPLDLTSPGSDSWPIEALASAADGTRVLASQPGLDRLLSIDPQDVQLVSTTDVFEPGAIVTAKDGTFRVAARGGVESYFQESGARAGGARLPRRLGSASFHASPCAGGSAEVVSVLARGTGEVHSVQPTTGQLAAPCDLGISRAHRQGTLEELVIAPDGRTAIAWSSRELVRFAPGPTGPVDALELFWGPPAGNGLSTLSLAASPGGRWVTAVADVDDAVIAVDLQAPWETARREIATDQSWLEAAHASDDGRLVVAGDNWLTFHDLNRLVDGKPATTGPTGLEVPAGERILGVGHAAGGRVLVLTTASGPVLARLVDASTGRLGTAWPIASEAVSAWAIAPRGEQVLVVDRSETGDQSAVAWHFTDPDTAPTLDLRVNLGPASAGTFTHAVYSASGGRAVVIAPIADRLVVVE